jgi:signal transduction histidine kinase
MELITWPYRPIFITNDGEEFPTSDLRHHLKGVGIMPNRRLQAFQTYLSEILKNPTTVYEFAPDDTLVRTDSSVLAYALHPPCQVLRNHNIQYCLDCDSTHARLFKGLAKNDIKGQLEKKIRDSLYINDYRTMEGQIIRINKANRRIFLEYDCPLLGYREIIFPIFFEERVLAIFFIGEITLTDKLKFIERRQKTFFDKNTAVGEVVAQEIQREHRKWLDNQSNILYGDQLQDLILRGEKAISEFEEDLQNYVNITRERYVRNVIEKAIKNFNQDLTKNQDLSVDEFLIQFWINLSSRLQEIVNRFGFDFILAFWTDQDSYDETVLMPVVAKGLKKSGKPDEWVKKIRFDPVKAQISELVIPTTSNEKVELFSGISGFVEALSNELSRIRVFPLLLERSGYLVIFVHYSNDNPGTSKENRIGSYIDQSARTFFANVSSSLASILATRERSRLELALSLYGHEIAQLSIGLDGLRATYLSSYSKIRCIPEKKAADIDRDLRGFLEHIYMNTRQARHVATRMKPEIKEVYPYRDLLFKWKNIYSAEEEKKKLQIYILHEPAHYRVVHGDPLLLEQLTYNLINNAIKYCFLGTKIILDCEQGNGYYEIVVIDYGMKCDTDPHKDIFAPYVRGGNVKDITGQGIGLYLARQIATLHGGEISIECKKVSNFNIPLLETALRQRIHPTWQLMEMEKAREQLGNRYYQIVALDSFNVLKYNNPSFYTIMNEIDEETFQVCFRARIPEKE